MTEDGIVRLRGYLAAQAMRQTPAQILNALQEASQRLVVAAGPIADRDSRPEEQAWSLAESVEHVHRFLVLYTTAICSVLETQERPPDVQGRDDILPRGGETHLRERFLDLQQTLDRLTQVVLQADPGAHLDVTWNHFELGAMHWREWLLFARVHLLDHVRQVEHLQRMHTE